MNFIQFRNELNKNFAEMQKSNVLYQVDLNKDELYELYQDSFPQGSNEIFRERREHDCSCCKNFIRTVGNVVSIKDGKIKTVWDIEAQGAYKPVAETLSSYIKSKAVSDVWVHYEQLVGAKNSKELLENGNIVTWDHFYTELDRKHLVSKDDVLTKMGNLRTDKQVFYRSLSEITKESIETVLELISQNSLYRGNEWKDVLNIFLKFKKEFDKLTDTKAKELFAWESVGKGIGSISRIRNHSMGTLLLELSEGADLETAIKKYEAIVAPENYKRSKPIYTKQMLEQARKKIEELGYMDSLGRRFATLDDITVNNILFANRDSAKKMEGDIFDEMLNEVAVNPKKLSKVEEISIDTFLKDVLPTTQEIELLLENKHEKNMMSLIAPMNIDSKTMFKWNNNFSWAYKGNLTDSSMRQNVKSAGGSVDGIMRFSIQWNDGDVHDGNDLDAHCIQPSGGTIYYGNERGTTGGRLDVDIINPKQNQPAVENITWKDTSLMKKGEYIFQVHNYSHRGGKKGFKAEIEINGEIYSFEYNRNINNDEKVTVATVHFDGQNFSIKKNLPSSVSSKEIWGLHTNQFVPVSVILNSPNYWDEQSGTGNKHTFFMLKDCHNPESPNGFYVEYLKDELRDSRKVFEALGGKMSVKDSENQLSGVGFSITQRNEVTLKVKGSFERLLKVKF